MNNLKIKEFESIAMTRVLLDGLVRPYDLSYLTTFPYKVAVSTCQTIICELLIEYGLNRIFWPYIRRKRIFLFYLPKKKVAAEIGIITDKSDNSMRKRLKIELMGYKGMALPTTFADLIENIDHPKHYFNKRRKNGVQKSFRAQKARE